MRRRILLIALLLAGCGGAAPAGLTLAALGLPLADHVDPLGAATLNTSPDGGIYQNPDRLSVLLVGHLPMHPLAERVGAGDRWTGLQPLGDLTVIGFRLRNDGKAGSDPHLNDLQVASDLAPDGTAGGSLRHFYHPAFPLAAVSDVSVTGECGIHLDPGQTVTVVLVYPPLRSTPQVTWGRYGDFALRLPPAGAMPGDRRDLRAAPCAAPGAAPT